MREYIPVLLFIAAAVSFAVITIAASTLIVPRRLNARKLAPYECGAEPIGNARSRIEIKFYLVGVLFILFDIEAVFLYPWAVELKNQVGTGGALFVLVEMLVFIAILVAGFAYAWGRGALDWDR